MFALPFYVLQSLIHNRLTYRKCTITTLPLKFCIMCIKRLNPPAAITFHLLHNVHQTYILGQDEKDMNMITHTTHLNHTTLCRINQHANIRMYALHFFVTNLRTRCLDMKYQMNVYFT